MVIEKQSERHYTLDVEQLCKELLTNEEFISFFSKYDKTNLLPEIMEGFEKMNQKNIELKQFAQELHNDNQKLFEQLKKSNDKMNLLSFGIAIFVGIIFAVLFYLNT